MYNKHSDSENKPSKVKIIGRSVKYLNRRLEQVTRRPGPGTHFRCCPPHTSTLNPILVE